MLREMVKTGLASGIHYTGMDRLIGNYRGEHQQPLVLSYHRVVNDFQASAGNTIESMLTSTRTLEQHIEWLSHYYRFISLDELITIMDSPSLSSRPVAVITFDDGYADVYHNAYPLLRRLGIPFGVFVVTDFIGTTRLHLHDELYLLLSEALKQWAAPLARIKALLEHIKPGPEGETLKERVELAGDDRYQLTRACFERLTQAESRRLIHVLREKISVEDAALEEFYPMDWDMLREMQANNVSIGSHTRSHSLLSHEASARARDEVSGSRQVLEQKLGVKIRHFAYPDGRFNLDIVRMVAEAGYHGGYTICNHQDPQYPWLTIPRKVLWENACLDSFGKFSPAIMSCQINGIFDPARKCRQEHGARPALEAKRITPQI